jgi:GH15 family glucan-1,4-alpha-glucosidase
VNKEIINKAAEIARRDLKGNYRLLGIHGGSNNHNELWGRDGLIACLASVEIGDIEVTERTLNSFKKYQRDDGMITERVETRNHGWHFAGINMVYDRPVPLYKSSQPWASEAVDPTAWYVIAAAAFQKTESGKVWWKDNRESPEKAGEWLSKKIGGNGLVKQGLGGDWADMTLWSGNRTYTNICTWKAFKELGWEEKAEKLGEAIDRQLWGEKKGYYIDRIGLRGKKHDFFSADGNLLSIAWNLADKKQATSIMNFIEEKSLNRIPVAPFYSGGKIWGQGWTNLIFPYYGSDKIFGWWGGWEVIGWEKIGDRAKAERDLQRMAEVIVKNGAVYEVIEENGEPVNGKLYKSERGASWAAAMYVYATSYLGLLK